MEIIFLCQDRNVSSNPIIEKSSYRTLHNVQTRVDFYRVRLK